MHRPLHPFRRIVAMLTLTASLLSTGATTSFAQNTPCESQQAPSSAIPSPPPESQSWISLPDMPRPRSELGAVTVDGTIYIAGGFGGGTMLDCYHTATGTWDIGTDIPAGVHHPGMAALDGIIYVAGGYTDQHVATDEVWAYDPVTDTWNARAPLPEAIGALGMAALDGQIYAVGGATSHLGGPASHSVHAYDPVSDTWAERDPLPTAREHLAVVASNDRVFAVGGRANGDEGDQYASAVEAYDPVSDTWEALSPLPTPRGGFAGAFVEGQLIFIGGERGTTTFDTVEAYNPATQTWTELPPVPTARHGVGVAGAGDTLFAIAGSTQAGVVENTGANEALIMSQKETD